VNLNVPAPDAEMLPTADVSRSIGVAEAVRGFDNALEPLAPHKVLNALFAARPEAPAIDWLAEIAAFHLLDRHPVESAGGQNYYPDQTEIPDRAPITPPFIKYWARRAHEAANPLLKGLYADLIWDLSRRVTQQAPGIEFARVAIDGYVDAARGRRLQYEHPTFGILARALCLALSVKDAPRIANAIQALIDYEDAVAIDNKPGLWGQSFDLLVKNPNVPLTEAQRTKIIGDMEGRLARTSDVQNLSTLDPWSAESAALPLADLYRRTGRPNDVRRVLQQFTIAFEEHSKHGSPLQVHAWLHRVHRILTQYGIADEAQRIAVALRTLGPSIKDDLKAIRTSMTIPADKMQEFVNELTAGTQDECLAKIAAHFIPRKARVQQQVKDIAASFIFPHIGSAAVQDHRGRTLATVGPITADPDGHLIQQMAQDMSLTSIFLFEALKGARSKFNLTAASLADYILRSAMLGEDDAPFVREGIAAYVDERFLPAIHLLVPRIESAFRNMFELTGSPVLRPNRLGGFDLISLGDMLRNELVTRVFGEDVPLYLSTLLVDARGWNLRNAVCHALISPGACGRQVADRVVHVFLLLARVQAKQTNPTIP